MPYGSIDELPPYVRKLPEKKQRVWMHVFNSAFKRCGGGKDCEGSAFAQANGVVKKSIVWLRRH